jgi:hypothetical protein
MASCLASFGSGRLVGGNGRVEDRVAHLMTWANGKIEWYKHYPDPEEARVAAERLTEERGHNSDL